MVEDHFEPVEPASPAHFEIERNVVEVVFLLPPRFPLAVPGKQHAQKGR
jgi:hypothetical protein